MNCKRIRKLMSDKADFPLPQKVERQFNTHLNQCSLCDMDMKAMLSAKQTLKAMYPSMNAPSGFKAAVMKDIISQRSIVSAYSLPLWFSKMYKPVAAIALSVALLFGLLTLDRNLSDLRAMPEEEQQAYENGTKTDVQQEMAETDVSNDNAFAQADSTEPLIEPKRPDEPPVTRTDEETTTVQEPPVIEEVPVIDGTFVSVPAEQKSPIVIDKAVAEIPSPVSQNGNVKIIEPVLTPANFAITVNEPIIFSEADIPDFNVFMRRKRIIEVTTLNISVQRIDRALLLLEDRAEFFRLKPDMTDTQIKENGTIAVMKSFLVPAGMADIFATQLSILGSVTNRKRSRLDITSDYSRMLEEHAKLVDEVVSSGTGVQQLKEHVEHLMFFDKRSQPGVENVVIWLEDGVDF